MWNSQKSIWWREIPIDWWKETVYRLQDSYIGTVTISLKSINKDLKSSWTEILDLPLSNSISLKVWGEGESMKASECTDRCLVQTKQTMKFLMRKAFPRIHNSESKLRKRSWNKRLQMWTKDYLKLTKW